MDIEFGNEYRTYGVGLGGYIEGMERGGVANRLNQMLMNPEEKFFSTLNLAFEKINDYRPLDANTRDLMADFATKCHIYHLKTPLHCSRVSCFNKA